MRQFVFTAILLFGTLMSFGQHWIKGKVLDENGHPLVGADIYLQKEGIGKTTDKNGTFLFENLKNKNYFLQVSYLGYETQWVETTPDKEITIQMNRISIEIDEITVTSLRANERSPIAYSEIKKEEIESRNLGQDIPYLLALTPSFIVTSDAGNGVGYTGFRIRGTDANRTNVTINGIPLNDAESHGTFFVDFPDLAASLSSVQVQRGVGTSTNGAAAFGASINMQTESVSLEPYADLSTSLGSFATNKNSIKVGSGMLDNNFAFDARLSNVTSDGYIDRASVDMQSYYFSGGYFSDKTVLRLLTFGGKEKTYQAWNGVDAEIMKTNRRYNDLGAYTDNNGELKFYDNQTDNYLQTHYHLYWLQKWNSHLHSNVATHLTRGIGYYEEYKIDKKYAEYGLTPAIIGFDTLKTTDLVRQKWLDNYFYGITGALNYEKKNTNFSLGGAVNRYDGEHYGKIIWVRNAANLDIGKDWYRSSSIKDDANIYAKLNTETFKNLFASIDLQYRYINYRMDGTDDKYDKINQSMRDITQQHIYHFFNPKFGFTWQPSTRNEFYASYSVSHREPNRNNFTEAGANERPTNETLYDTEAGYRFRSSRFSAGTNFYYMKYKNQLILTGKVSEIGEFLTTNIPDSYRAGIELTAGWKITNFLNWDGNCTFSHNKIKNFTEQDIDVYDENWNYIGTRNNELGTTDIAYSPNVIANSIFSFHLKPFEAAFHSNYVSRQYIDNTSDIQRSIDPYFVQNLNLKYSLAISPIKTLEFLVQINNLFNEKYETNGYTWYSCYLGNERHNELRYFPQAGTNFLASARLKF
ncbi:MAG TPA: TonB-dependent receptor [Paludibacteraceae bacterium]|nr:TonB-dependent receptor [Paludibacteraceae bacterium]HOL29459.1 TonB-dependent receptor [Paludibacteraceae bacterium]HON02273.1 TonB-dependent receptor [Paludibacteraceae bacterium]HPQ12888.1 TonB-dependent receptor [Paludibacteraceae bacterium]HRT78561.1 TonB-dependent receptor [Paludibacteraceae bacterium]